MRILVISDLPHFVTGGAETQAAQLIGQWMAAGHDVSCYGRRMGCGHVHIDGYKLSVRRIFVVQKFGRAIRAASYFVSLTMLLLRYGRRFDVIYTRFLGDAAVTVCLLKRIRLLHTVLIATPASAGEGSDLRYLASVPFTRWIVRLLDQHCEAINLIALTMEREFLTNMFTGNNFTHIPNGVAVERHWSSSVSGKFAFLAIGRLAHQKGYDILLRALSQVIDDLSPGIVRIAGDGPEAVKLYSLADSLGLSDVVTWLGEVSHEEVKVELGQASVFLLPSRYEGMSNAGLEAMERGLPVIISRCGGLDTYIDAEMGWVVEPGDECSLARALRTALATSAERLAERGARNRQVIVKQFDNKVVARRYLELFEHLLDNQRSGRTA